MSLEEGQDRFYPVTVLQNSYVMAIFGHFVSADIKDLIVGIFGA